MSVGTAILIVGIVTLVVWQIDKRGAWRKTGKVVLLTVLGIAVVFAIVLGYSYWDDQKLESERRRLVNEQVQRIKEHGVDTYLGVRLGMSENEVRYLLGPPTSISTTTNLAGFEVWRYSADSDNFRKNVVLGPSGVAVMNCRAHFSQQCPELLGIGIGTSEAELLDQLGEPSKAPEVGDDGIKDMRYGPRARQVQFELRQSAVSQIAVADVEQIAKAHGLP